MSLRLELLAALSLGVASPALFAAGAIAQTAPETASSASADTGIEEVVVTARKHSESAQKTPIAIAAFSEAQVEQQQITQLKDLSMSVPGFSFQATSEDMFNGLISLRGISTQNIAQDLDPGVAVYVDGVYQGFSGENLSDANDIARIEVLKGPQGTLFGRNSTGGAIQVFHNLPTDDFEGWVRGGVGNEDRHEGAAMLNIPIVEGKAELRVVGSYTEDSGYGTDYGVINKGRPYGDMQETSLYATLRLAPTDDLQIFLRGGYEKGRSDGAIAQLTYVQPGSLTAAELYQDTFPAGTTIPGTPFPIGDICFAAPAACVPASNAAVALAHSYGKYNEASNFPNADESGKLDGSLEIDYKINDSLDVKSISAVMRGYRFVNDDLVGSIYGVGNSNQDTSENEITQELTFIGTGLDSRLSYQSGVYYYYKTAKDNQDGIFGLNVIPPQGTGGLDFARDHAESISPYAQATYKLTDQVNVTSGIRWTKEDKDVFLEAYNLPTFPDVPLSCPGFTATNCRTVGAGTFYATSYLFELDYSPIENSMFYVKTSRGFRSGGQQETAPGRPGFAPETLTDYEIGEKGDFFDHKVRANIDIYHSDYNNLQQNLYQLVDGVSFSSIINAGNAQVEGLEWQFAVEPLPRFILSTNGAFTYPHYLSYEDVLPSGQLADLKSTPFPNVARWAFSIGAEYSIPVNDGDLINLNLDYHWQSKTTGETVPTNAVASLKDFYADGITGMSSYGLLNGRVSYHWDAQDMDFAFWGKNLLDKYYISYIQDFTGQAGTGSLGFNAATPGFPRTFGVQVTKHFGGPSAEPVAYAPPPTPVAPPAPPPPAPAVEAARSFQVFFDFDKSDITAAAAKVIQAAADAVKAGHVVQITVTGHTDTVGSAAYNQGLSERRAAAVKTGLVADGVAGGEITTIGVGKTGLLVATADGVREPQNRRAEIVLQ
jgi:iron complex outermembrane receptor protein